MTLFILGIFTGIGIAILLGHYLNNQRKKSGVPKNSNPPAPPKQGAIGIYIDGRYIAGLTSTEMDSNIQVTEKTSGQSYQASFYKDFSVFSQVLRGSLEEQLNAALEREDYKEAVRLRDLINRK